MAFVHVSGLCWSFFGYHLLTIAKQAGVRLIDRPVNTVSEQVQEIESVLRDDLDVLLFRPMLTDDPKLLAILRHAQALGVHLISIDGLPGGGMDVCSVTADNFGGQAALANFMFRRMKGKGRIAYFQGDLSTEAGVQRNKGLQSVLLQFPGIELVHAEAYNWSSTTPGFQQGVEMARKVLTVHPDLDVIISVTDESALGVCAVLEESGLLGKIRVTGFDGLPEAITALSTGRLEVTARQPLDTMSRLAFDLAMGLLKGEVRTIVHYVQDVDLLTQANLGDAAMRALRVFPEVTADLNRRTTEQRNNAAFLEALFDVMPTMVVVKSAKDLRYIRANKARDEWLNVPRGSQIGKYAEDFYAADVVARYNAEDRRLLEIGLPLEIPEEESFREGLGTRYSRTRKIPLLDAQGKPEYLMVISEDTTQQKLTKQALVEHARELEKTRKALKKNAEKLAEAEKMAALGTLVAGVSHELNTPIGNALLAVTTYADHTRRITEKAGAGLTRSALENYLGDAKTGIDILVRNLRRSAELIQSFKQIAVDQTTSQTRTFALATVVDDMLMAFSYTQKNSPYGVDRDIPVDLVLNSYPGPLEQVLMNLINNALIHAFEGRASGTITISARPAQPGWAELVVSDDGIGIASEHIKRIFDPFFSTKFGKGSSGLGLSICNTIVTRLLGGQIDVSSAPGQGAQVCLLIPLQAPAAHE